MYHIKNDLRAKKSSNLLYQAFLELLKEKDIGDISISDLSKRSTVSRATFYRNFDHPIDLLHWKCHEEFHTILSQFVQERREGNFLFYILEHWMNHAELIEVLFSIGRLDIVFQSLYQNATIIEDYALKQGITFQTPSNHYSLAIRAGYFIGLLKAWIDSGKKESAQELFELIKKQHQEVLSAGDLL